MGTTRLGRLRDLAIDAARIGLRMTANRCAGLDPQRLVKTLQGVIFGPFVATRAHDTAVQEVAEQDVSLRTRT